MILTFVAPSTSKPIGGVMVIYEFASAMAARGHDVHLFHTRFWEHAARSIADLPPFEFSPRVTHHFPGPQGAPAPEDVPTADAIFAFRTDTEMPRHFGHPVVLIQGYRMLAEEVEHRAYHASCPKVCVAGWLVDVGRTLGVPTRQLVHVPLGFRPERYPMRTPYRDRPPKVAFCYNSHPQKGADVALAALAALKESVPELEAVAFGNTPRAHDLPSWVELRTDPSHEELVDEVYNPARIFLCASRVEGFGLPALEAMSCGAALVTTDNGGSREYAHDNETALVAPPDDLDAIVSRLRALLLDDERRITLAQAGREYTQRFDWARSASRLETFLEAYLADPAAYGRPT